MPTLIQSATRVQAAGNMPKLIDEYIGRVNTSDERLSVAHMSSPAGWQEPGQTPEFDEYTIVLKGRLRVTHRKGWFDVAAGQAVIAHTPDEATEYVAICLPAFSPDTVHREA